MFMVVTLTVTIRLNNQRRSGAVVFEARQRQNRSLLASARRVNAAHNDHTAWSTPSTTPQAYTRSCAPVGVPIAPGLIGSSFCPPFGVTIE